MKKTRIILTAIILAAMLLTGCASSTTGTSTMNAGAADSAVAAYYEAAAEAGYGDGWMPETEPQERTFGTGGTIPANVKIIYTASISLESTEFDAAADGLEALVNELDGWFESSSLDNNSRSYRRASYTIRVPSRNFASFCDRIGALCKVNSLYMDADDVSEAYYDVESRLATQRTKLERLQSLLADAENMEDIITLETAISETELVIENLTGSLRKYDSLVDYSTITVTLNEVYQLTQTEEPAIGFGAKLSAAFRAGSRSFVSGMQDLLLGFARGWAGWLLFIAIVVIVILMIRGARRRRREREGTESVPRKKRSRRGRRKAESEEEAAEIANTEEDKK